MTGRQLLLKLTMFILVGVVCLVVKRATMLGRGCQERTVVHLQDTILHKATHSCSSCVWSRLWYISEGQYDILCPVIKALYLLRNKGEIQCKASYFWPRPCLQGWGAEAPDSGPALLKWRTCTRLDCTEWWHDHCWFFFFLISLTIYPIEEHILKLQDRKYGSRQKGGWMLWHFLREQGEQ